jgi:predicted nucleic acid-binding protein
VRYLLDSDWVIDYLHQVGQTVRRVDELAHHGLGLSIVSLAELHEGLVTSQDRRADERRLRNFLIGVTVIGLDEETCRIFGRERSRLRAEGNLIGDLDLLIGATALRHGLTVLTNNRRHFGRIEGLAVESA